MAQHDQEKVRRLLKAALNKLDGESHSDKDSSNSIGLSENDAGPAVILVIVDGLNAQDGDAPQALAAGRSQRETEASSAFSLDQTQGAHPGLERFTLAVTDSFPTAAPKACFMEPRRTCVNSGACEMRGF